MSDNPSGDLLSRAEGAYRRSVADPASAGAVAAAVVADARQAGHIEALVVGLRAQAWSARELLAGEDAKSLLDDAVRLARRHGLPLRLGELLVSRGAVNVELGRFRSARRDLDQARTLVGDSSFELDLQSAVLDHNAGRLRAAADTYRRVIANRGCDGDVRVRVLNNLGLLEADLGHYSAADVLLVEAEALAHVVGPAPLAYVAETRAWVMARSGRLPASLDLFQEAERLYDLAGLPAAELHSEQADAMSDLLLLPEAAEAAQRAVREFSANGVPLMRADALLRLARLSLLADNLDAAAAAASAAEDDFRQQRRSRWAASAIVVAIEARARANEVTDADLRRVRAAATRLDQLNITSSAVEAHLTAARVAVLLGRTTWALASLDRASALARDTPVLTRLKGRLAGATAAGLRGDDRRLLQQCRSGLADLDRHRVVLASTELRVLASAHGAELGNLGLRSLLESGAPSDVFTWMERTRAAALLAVQRGAVDGLEELAALRGLQAEIDAAGGDSSALVTRHSALEHRLRRMSWGKTSNLTSTFGPPRAAEVRALLDERWLIEYGILDGDVFAAVVSPRRVRLVRLGPVAAVQQEIDGLFFVLRLLSRRASAATTPALRTVVEQRLHRLRALLMVPLGLPAAARELVIVPAGPLQRAPWSALHDGPVAVTPSAAFWLRSRTRAIPGRERVVLVAGPGLPAAEEEVRQLAALHDRQEVLAPPESTVANVAASLETATLAHFACHGEVRADNPMFSGLLLSDGSLSVQELELRDIAPHRIILAACEAAADVAYAGGEVLGFVSALLARGTAGMVASTILVPDASAVPLMLALHENLRGGATLAVALQAARSAVNTHDPHELVNWCGFTAYGAA